MRATPDPAKGAAAALTAYVLWGLLPVYWKALAAVPAVEILAHRIVWSLLILLGLGIGLGHGRALRAECRLRRSVGWSAVAGLLLTSNWLLYIYAVNSGHIVETSLGYYINPLVSVALGMVFLDERLGRVQSWAVGLAAVGVAYLTWRFGAVPWIALGLAATFGSYGLTKKLGGLPTLHGLILETALVAGPAVAYLVWLEASGRAAFGHSGWRGSILLVGAGPVTALPLLLFAAATRRVRLSTLGVLQYVSPTCALVIGVLGYGEPFPAERAVGFGFVWLGLAVYSADHLARGRAALTMRQG